MAIEYSYDIKNLKEDVAQPLNKISQDETPILDKLSKPTCSNPLNTQWIEDVSPDADSDNAHMEGADVTDVDNGTQPSFKSNVCQIHKFTYGISGTAESLSEIHGRKKEEFYQMVHIGTKARKTIEKNIFKNQASQAQSGDSTPRKLGGLESWMETNVSRFAGDPNNSNAGAGVNGGYQNGYTTVATNGGSQRAITEDILNSVIKLMKDNGAPTNNLKLVVGTYNKQLISKTFNGYNQRNLEMTRDGQINSAVSIYNHDFGAAQIMTCHQMDPRNAWLINFEHFKLRPLKGRYEQISDLAKTGDSKKRMVVYEYTTEVHEKGLGQIADLTTS